MIRPASMGRRRPARGGWLPVCATLWLLSDAALAQTQQPQLPPAEPAPQSQSQTQSQTQPPPAPQLEPAQPAPPAQREGFLEALGRWWEKSARDFKASVEENNEKWRRSVEETNAKLKASVEDSNAKWRELGRKTEQATREATAAQKEAADELLKAQKEAATALANLPKVRMVEGRQTCEIAPNGSPDCQAAAEVICKGKGFATGKSADITTTRKCSARALLRRDASECRTETVVIKAACQ